MFTAAAAALLVVPLTVAGLVPVLALAGLGLGTFTPADNTMIMGAIPARSSGTGGGLVNMTRGLGTALGVALVTLALHLGSGGGTEAGAQWSALILTGVSAVALTSAWLGPGRRRPGRETPAEPDRGRSGTVLRNKSERVRDAWTTGLAVLVTAGTGDRRGAVAGRPAGRAGRGGAVGAVPASRQGRLAVRAYRRGYGQAGPLSAVLNGTPGKAVADRIALFGGGPLAVGGTHGHARHGGRGAPKPATCRPSPTSRKQTPRRAHPWTCPS
ncbi:hypothetical protein ACH4ZX_17435 [Streptomyces sp. NPDC020490]|uniref:hypothetical protein n=1 Tax=Streptomyces sp. NPDC020490 TaxID=3365078 RepID=UPI0037AC21CA